MGTASERFVVMFNEDSSSMSTPQLRQRLNRLFTNNRIKGSEQRRRQFDLLWDVKELALMERRQSVEIPTGWLDELEQFAGSEEIKGA